MTTIPWKGDKQLELSNYDTDCFKAYIPAGESEEDHPKSYFHHRQLKKKLLWITNSIHLQNTDFSWGRLCVNICEIHVCSVRLASCGVADRSRPLTLSASVVREHYITILRPCAIFVTWKQRRSEHFSDENGHFGRFWWFLMITIWFMNQRLWISNPCNTSPMDPMGYKSLRWIKVPFRKCTPLLSLGVWKIKCISRSDRWKNLNHSQIEGPRNHPHIGKIHWRHTFSVCANIKPFKTSTGTRANM